MIFSIGRSFLGPKNCHNRRLSLYPKLSVKGMLRSFIFRRYRWQLLVSLQARSCLFKSLFCTFATADLRCIQCHVIDMTLETLTFSYQQECNGTIDDRASEIKFDLWFGLCDPKLPWYPCASAQQPPRPWRPRTASEARSDFEIQLSDLDYLCYRALASNGHYFKKLAWMCKTEGSTCWDESLH